MDRSEEVRRKLLNIGVCKECGKDKPIGEVTSGLILGERIRCNDCANAMVEKMQEMINNRKAKKGIHE